MIQLIHTGGVYSKRKGVTEFCRHHSNCYVGIVYCLGAWGWLRCSTCLCSVFGTDFYRENTGIPFCSLFPLEVMIISPPPPKKKETSEEVTYNKLKCRSILGRHSRNTKSKYLNQTKAEIWEKKGWLKLSFKKSYHISHMCSYHCKSLIKGRSLTEVWLSLHFACIRIIFPQLLMRVSTCLPLTRLNCVSILPASSH